MYTGLSPQCGRLLVSCGSSTPHDLSGGKQRSRVTPDARVASHSPPLPSHPDRSRLRGDL